MPSEFSNFHFIFIFYIQTIMLHLPNGVKAPINNNSNRSSYNNNSNNSNNDKSNRPQRQHQHIQQLQPPKRLDYHKTKGSLLRQPPKNKINIDRCDDISKLSEIIDRFDRMYVYFFV